ncbi:peptidase M24 [Halobacteriales archaeon QH_9_66_26]|nr:MAG: peptidase M24 [Halobacteriales archaeon QH_9_66_26]
MTPPHPKVTSHLRRTNADGYLIDADGDDSNQYYLSGYHAPDDFVTLYADGDVSLLVSGLEYTRAKTDSDGGEVRTLAEFGYREKAEEVDPRKAGTADVLREHGIDVVWDDEYVLEAVRAVKNEREIEHIRETQRANENAMAVAEDLLERATVADGVLHLDGEVLTSEKVRQRIEIALLERECGMNECIVAAGAAAARGHDAGSGPLEANVPIIVDIFPRHKRTRYFGDMTRTFVKGEPDDRIVEWYELASEAYATALDTVRAGVTGETVHDAVCEVFEAAGQPTPRTDESTEDGFTHSTGHGVGLDVHEAPYLAQQGGELEAGHVVTVEPGLYEQGTGGVRIEDLVVVTEDGYENLTEYPTDLRVV